MTLRLIGMRILITAMLAFLTVTPVLAQTAPGGRSAVLHHLASRACDAVLGGRPAPVATWSARTLATCASLPATPVPGAVAVPAAFQPSAPDGAIVGRQRVAENSAVVLEVVAYASDGLTVGGLLCYPNDGTPHSTVVHVHGGLGGVFSKADGDLVTTCYNWAALHGRTAFAPSLRGQDGGEGRAELCLGESTDVINAVAMLRGIEPTMTSPVALVGGSIGGCVVLRAAPFIPDLSAVVAFVPPTTWGDLVAFHRSTWAPAQETLCDGTTRTWDIGGPELADTFDRIICGQVGCTAEDYLARSPLTFVAAQSAPTLIVAAMTDSVVPFEQQLLWSIFRQGSGAPVDVVVVDKCAAPGRPALSFDGLLAVEQGFHLLADGPISSGMLFLLGHLDRAAALP